MFIHGEFLYLIAPSSTSPETNSVGYIAIPLSESSSSTDLTMKELDLDFPDGQDMMRIYPPSSEFTCPGFLRGPLLPSPADENSVSTSISVFSPFQINEETQEIRITQRQPVCTDAIYPSASKWQVGGWSGNNCLRIVLGPVRAGRLGWGKPVSALEVFNHDLSAGSATSHQLELPESEPLIVDHNVQLEFDDHLGIVVVPGFTRWGVRKMMVLSY